MRGKGTNQSSFERMRNKKAERRRPHRDKYADKASGTKAPTNPETNDERR